MNTIHLPNGIWQYDSTQKLGPRGGFGIVFAGYSEIMGEVAVKEITQEAQREIRIADELLNKKYQYVIPIYDAGQDTESGKNYLVMAKAQKSLQDEIKVKPKFEDHEAVSILLQIVNGLLEVPSLVHRDLKPGNVLFHSGVWKIADFGIAKFIEESTSLQTLRECLTPSYAAPEQWNLEHPTNAVDIYALGCIAFTLLTGTPPFLGTPEELKEQHLHHQPPISKIPNPRLQTLVGMMLRKTPVTRPSQERVKTQLEQLTNSGKNNSSGSLQKLSEAAAKIAEDSIEKEAYELSVKSTNERRRVIAYEAQDILSGIVDMLFQRILVNAPNSIVSTSSKNFGSYAPFPNRSISLGDAELSFNFVKFSSIPADAFKQSGWDVFAGAIVKVTQKAREPYVWSANLWYTNLGKGQEYRWWEVSYMANPLMRSHPKYEPYAEEDISNADLAASPIMAHVQFGSEPKLVDDEFVNSFCDRWIELLAKAVNGQLSSPSRLPID